MTATADPSSVKDEIVGWFGRVKLAGLELPGGWFGRPHGDLHQLTWAGASRRRALVELDDHLLLVITGPEGVEGDDRSLTVASFAHLAFCWEEFANHRPHVESFDRGPLRFWAQGSQLPAR